MIRMYIRRHCCKSTWVISTLHIWALLIVLNGCSMAPDYVQPPLPIAANYPNLSEYQPDDAAVTKISAAQLDWQQFYHQPELRNIIQKALQNNRDLRKAVLNIEQAQLLYNVQCNELLPKIDASAKFSRQRTGKEVSLPGSPLLTQEYQVGLGITAFELDLFGRIESLSDEALASYKVVTETAQATKISLIAAVAHAYYNERSLIAQLDLAKQTVAIGIQAYRLIQQQYDSGNIALDILKIQQGRLHQYHIQAAEFTRLHAQAYNTLVMLVGQPSLDKLSAPFAKILDIDTKSFISLPSDLLLYRPDIVAAEQQLKAAHAHIGVARAAFFPRISLTTFLGSASPQLSHLFKHDNRTWNFSPTLTLPIFDWGTNLTNLDLAGVRKNIEIASYENSIQTAFKEVADALVARAMYHQQSYDQKGLVASVKEQTVLMKQRYQHGMVSHLEVLNILQDLYQSQQAYIQFQQAQMDNTIDLYKALGGGRQ